LDFADGVSFVNVFHRLVLLDKAATSRQVSLNVTSDLKHTSTTNEHPVVPNPTPRSTLHERQIELTYDGKTEIMLVPARTTFCDFKSLLALTNGSTQLFYKDRDDNNVELITDQDWTMAIDNWGAKDLLRICVLNSAASPAWDAKMSPSAYFLDALLQRLITAFEASVLVKHLGALTREMMKDLSRDSMAGCFNLHIPQLVALLTCPSTTVKSYLVSIFEIIWSLNESEMDILRDTFGTRTPLSSESVQKGSDFFFFFAPSAQTKVEPRNRKELQKAHFEQIAKVLQAISTSSTLGSLSED